MCATVSNNEVSHSAIFKYCYYDPESANEFLAFAATRDERSHILPPYGVCSHFVTANMLYGMFRPFYNITHINTAINTQWQPTSHVPIDMYLSIY